MTDPTITDLRRELAKAREALASAETHLARHAESNAALHCADRVMCSPLHAKVTNAVQQIDHALERTVPARVPTLDHRIPAVVAALRAGIGQPGRREADARRVLAALDQQQTCPVASHPYQGEGPGHACTARGYGTACGTAWEDHTTTRTEETDRA